MAKREDPFMLINYSFLPQRQRNFVDNFINKLDSTHREFAIKRYVESKPFYQVAEEMGYVERTLYSLRDRVLSLWSLITFNTDLDYHRERILCAIKRYGIVEHYRLVNNLHLNRFNLKHSDFKSIIETLIATGQVKILISPSQKGRPKRKYIIINSAIIQPLFSQEITS